MKSGTMIPGTMKHSLILLCLVLASCTSIVTEPFYWGNYSRTAYEYAKNPTGKTRENHQRELIRIIEVSDKRKRLVAPGIHAELARLYWQQGDSQRAETHWQKEVQLYPESRPFLDFYSSKMGVRK